MRDRRTTTEKFEKAQSQTPLAPVVLRLYVADMEPRSIRTVEAIQAICRKHLHGHYSLEVIDIYKRPKMLKSDNILAVPTLIRRSPKPLRRFIGDLSKTNKVLAGLGLPPAA